MIEPTASSGKRLGYRWSYCLILVVGIAFLAAVVPLAEFLNNWLWTEFWSGSRWGAQNFYRIDSKNGVLQDPIIRSMVIGSLVWGFPFVAMVTGLLFRIRPFWLIAYCFTLMLMLIAILLVVFSYHPPYEEFVQLLIECSLVSIVGCGVLLTLEAIASADATEDACDLKKGIRNYPIRSWIILAMGFVFMQLSISLSKYINDFIWELLQQHFNTWNWSGYHSRALSPTIHNGALIGGLHFIATNTVLHIVPFLLLVFALKLRMHPWLFWILGLLLTGLFYLVFWIFENFSSILEEISLSFITGQTLGAIGVLLLCVYHQKVTRHRFGAELDVDEIS